MLLGTLALLAVVGGVAAWQYAPLAMDRLAALFARAKIEPGIENPNSNNRIEPAPIKKLPENPWSNP
jgi:hypothetical protein